MEELNIEELKKRKAKIQEKLENNAEIVGKAVEVMYNVKKRVERKQLIIGIIKLFSATVVSVACFTLSNSTFTNVVGWISAIFVGLMFFAYLLYFLILCVLKKQVGTVTDTNANLEKELKEINDKLEENQTNIKI